MATLPDGSTVLQGGRSRRGKLRGPPGSKDLVTALKGCDDPLFLDFKRRCMEWDPAQRMTPPQALRHAWLRRRLPKNQNEDSNQTVARKGSGTRPAVSKIASSPNNIKGKIAPLSDDLAFNTRTKPPQIGSTM